MQNMQTNMSKNMQTSFQYAEYWQVYILHIGNIYALPTLLMKVFIARFLARGALIGARRWAQRPLPWDLDPVPRPARPGPLAPGSESASTTICYYGGQLPSQVGLETSRAESLSQNVTPKMHKCHPESHRQCSVLGAQSCLVLGPGIPTEKISLIQKMLYFQAILAVYRECVGF